MQNNKSVVSVYDYSANTDGTTVSGVSEQVNQFIPSVNHAPWKRNSTLFSIPLLEATDSSNMDWNTRYHPEFKCRNTINAIIRFTRTTIRSRRTKLSPPKYPTLR